MTVEAIRDWIHRQPFQPFRITTSSGDAYEIRHPEMAFLTRAEIVIGLGERDGIPSRYRTVSLLHVTAAEPIDSSAAA
ncbi:MAG: hypothetical protein ACKOSQ_12705 [Planctomycetaceae bacterium]